VKGFLIRKIHTLTHPPQKVGCVPVFHWVPALELGPLISWLCFKGWGAGCKCGHVSAPELKAFSGLF
jgi:hypothetical protein